VEGEYVRTIARADLDAWVEALLAYAEVIAPTRGQGGDELFATIRAAGDVLWQFENPALPPKSVLLPQTDPLVRIRRHNGDGYVIEPVPEKERRVLLNVRSCDAVALAYLRQMHEQDLPDQSVIRRADRLTVVTLACHRPCAQGFCICCDAGPFLDANYDLQLTDLGESFLVEIGTEKGAALVARAPHLFLAAGEPERAARTSLEQEARAHFGEETCHFGSAMRRISARRVAPALWDAMSPWCLECGGCTLACPTCYCFSISDHADEDGCWTRCRTWDSCQYAAFTMEASGHNPRQAHGERMKRRFHHKASAQYFVKDGRLGCVGCGRCVRVCMGTTDMPAVVAAIRRGTWAGGRSA
jgi:ferredoxin